MSNFMFYLCITLYSVVVVGVFYEDLVVQPDKMQAFAYTCEQKGGKALKGIDIGHSDWYGCYKGVTEIDNEPSK